MSNIVLPLPWPLSWPLSLLRLLGLIFLLILVGCEKPDSTTPGPPQQTNGTSPANDETAQENDDTNQAQDDTSHEIVLKRIEPEPDDTKPAIENLIQIGPRLYSGGEPKTKAAFEQIAKLGCQTIVSVDGAKPNLEWAEEFGLSYVHIPIGYDGLSRDAQWAIVNAIRTHPGPIFFHCHHGKHRGPAAAAIGLMADTQCDPAIARKLLELGGTSPDYPGLWRDVAQYQAPPTDAQLPQLSTVAEVDSLVAAMSSLDRAFDELKLCRAAQWKAPSDHPDLAPLTLATLVREGFAESKRMAEAGEVDESIEFRDWLIESEQQASRLEQSLREGRTDQAEAAFAALAMGCQQCHQKYRN